MAMNVGVASDSPARISSEREIFGTVNIKCVRCSLFSSTFLYAFFANYRYLYLPSTSLCLQLDIIKFLPLLLLACIFIK
jgi:hypothetical protein